MRKDLLKFKSQGELVTLLQHRLSELGYTTDVDGYFGKQTENVVKQFQKVNKLKQDGIVGAGTWQIIDELFAKKKNTKDIVLPEDRSLKGSLHKGDKGEFVSLLQQMLLDLGYRIAVDGHFGVGTERFVIQFQKDNKLVQDGIVGVQTWQILTERVHNATKKDPTPNNGKLDREFFFSQIKKEKLFTTIKQNQLDGINYILDCWEKSGLRDLRWLAYMLATAYHETAYTMQPIEEYGKGKGRPYGAKIKMNGSKYTHPDKIYYGRGYVQLTWYENYDKMGRILGVDLLHKPELALKQDIAAKIMLEGMTLGVSAKGDFTGKALEDYFNGKTEDWVNARRIINGKDKAEKIAAEGKKFYASLRFFNAG